ncbi:hypothetical protein D3C85_1701630 [compost metagenome]
MLFDQLLVLDHIEDQVRDAELLRHAQRALAMGGGGSGAEGHGKQRRVCRDATQTEGIEGHEDEGSLGWLVRTEDDRRS